MNSVKKITIHLCVYLLIGITGMLITNKAVFLHFHKMADGSIVAHAHPHNKSAGTQDSHHHSSAEIVFLDHLNLLFPFLLLLFFILYRNGRKLNPFITEHICLDNRLHHQPCRAPPF